MSASAAASSSQSGAVENVEDEGENLDSDGEGSEHHVVASGGKRRRRVLSTTRVLQQILGKLELLDKRMGGLENSVKVLENNVKVL